MKFPKKSAMFIARPNGPGMPIPPIIPRPSIGVVSGMAPSGAPVIASIVSSTGSTGSRISSTGGSL